MKKIFEIGLLMLGLLVLVSVLVNIVGFNVGNPAKGKVADVEDVEKAVNTDNGSSTDVEINRNAPIKRIDTVGINKKLDDLDNILGYILLFSILSATMSLVLFLEVMEIDRFIKIWLSHLP